MRFPFKPVAAFTLSTVFCGAASLAPLHAAPTAAKVLSEMVQADKVLSYTATETVVRQGTPPVRVKVQRAGRKRRFEYLAPDIRRGDAVIDDGKTVWIYLRGENAAVQTLSRGDQEFVLRPGIQSRVAGVGSIDDRLTWIVELTRAGNRDNQRRLWVDQKNGAVLRREMRRGGEVVESSALSDIRFGAVPAGVFTWTPPAGANVSRTSGTLYVSANAARRRAMLKFPSWIPKGYSFESAIVDEKKVEAWVRFSGAKRFSIFQSRADRDTPLQKVDGAWFLARGGNRFVIVGLDESDARQLAGSL